MLIKSTKRKQILRAFVYPYVSNTMLFSVASFRLINKRSIRQMHRKTKSSRQAGKNHLTQA